MKSFICTQNKKLSKIVFSYCSDLSYSAFRKALRNKDVKVNGVRISNDLLLNVGDKVEIYYTPKTVEPFSILFKDQNVLVIDKKSGFSSETVYENVKQEYQNAGFIHRLDTNTSGIMIFSLNQRAESELLNGFKTHTFVKEYIAEVVGKLPNKEGILEGYLLKDKTLATVKVFASQVKGSSYIKTGYKVIEEREQTSVVLVRLYTGKTHQIRAHFSHIGHPVLGDGKYGDYQMNKKFKVSSQKLISNRLVLYFSREESLYYLNSKEFIINKI